MRKPKRLGRKPTTLTRGHNAVIALMILVAAVWFVTFITAALAINHLLLDDAVDVTAVMDTIKSIFSGE